METAATIRPDEGISKLTKQRIPNGPDQSSLDWLLGPDPGNPGVRYFALRDLLGEAEDAP